MPKLSEHKLSTICAVGERPDHHCGDDLVLSYYGAFEVEGLSSNHPTQLLLRTRQLIPSFVAHNWIKNFGRQELHFASAYQPTGNLQVQHLQNGHFAWVFEHNTRSENYASIR